MFRLGGLECAGSRKFPKMVLIPSSVLASDLQLPLAAACEPSVRVLATEDAAGCPHCACGELGNIPYKRGRVLPACTRAGIVLAWYDHGGLKPAWVPSPVEWDPGPAC